MHPIDVFATRCEYLAEAMRSQSPRGVRRPDESEEFREVESFFEAYFSNQIEGSELSVGEAQRVVADEQYEAATEAKRQDARDLRGTIRAITDPALRADSSVEFVHWRRTIRRRHLLMMAHRGEEMRPGEWKLDPNRAGGKKFIPPRLVEEALRVGHRMIKSCEQGMARGIMNLFVITSIHPFVDGNGRSSRMAMNAELSKEGLARMVVTEHSRKGMIAGLKRLESRRKSNRLIDEMQEIQRWSASVDWSSKAVAIARLRADGLMDGTELSDG